MTSPLEDWLNASKVDGNWVEDRSDVVSLRKDERDEGTELG